MATSAALSSGNVDPVTDADGRGEVGAVMALAARRRGEDSGRGEPGAERPSIGDEALGVVLPPPVAVIPGAKK